MKCQYILVEFHRTCPGHQQSFMEFHKAILENQGNLEEILNKFLVSTVPADGPLI